VTYPYEANKVLFKKRKTSEEYEYEYLEDEENEYQESVSKKLDNMLDNSTDLNT
jgi:hypothetical protein